MNEGGKRAGGRQVRARRAAWDQFLYNPLGRTAGPFCASNQTPGNGDADDPAGQNFNCVVVSNDFQQYWLGAYLPISSAATRTRAAALHAARERAVRLAAVRRSTGRTRRPTRTTCTRS